MQINLTKAELKRISEIVDTFKIDDIDIKQEHSSGIGCSVEVSFKHELQGVKGKFVIDLTDVSTW